MLESLMMIVVRSAKVARQDSFLQTRQRAALLAQKESFKHWQLQTRTTASIVKKGNTLWRRTQHARCARPGFTRPSKLCVNHAMTISTRETLFVLNLPILRCLLPFLYPFYHDDTLIMTRTG